QTWLKRVDLGGFADAYPKHFSRGMCQKLNLIRALMQEPDILLLDEPSTGLDQKSQHFLREALRNLRKQGKAILLITHALTEDRPLADMILRLEKGTIFKEPPLSCSA
ncbi:MAG: ATP-binding cassette domain-containing protein, partial [Desulfovibrio sp.]|nr:ATP-binding cassette domain-containing protein [Desulfovibrio sp.]